MTYKPTGVTLIERITVSDDARTLQITSTCGDTADLPATTLRQRAMDATSRKERLQNGSINVIPGLQITVVQTVGSTGVNIQFSDGHHRAIFPYSYLTKIAFGADN